MPKVAPPKSPGRYMVEVDPAVRRAMDSIRAKLGNPHKMSLHTAALLHVVKQVRAGELIYTNGELRPTGGN